MGRPSGPTRDTKRLICEHALEVFAEKGYAATTMRDVATAVGMRDASLYSHYPSKQAIFDAAVEHQLNRLTRALHSRRALAHPADDASAYLADGPALTKVVLASYEPLFADAGIVRLRHVLEGARRAYPRCDELYRTVFIERPARAAARDLLAPRRRRTLLPLRHSPRRAAVPRSRIPGPLRGHALAAGARPRGAAPRRVSRPAPSEGVSMSTAIVYCSQTGFTERYARWLAEELGTRAVPFAERTSSSVANAKTLVFLGWFHAGGLKGARWLREVMDGRPERRYVVMGVGAYPMPSEEWPKSETDAAFEHAFPSDRYPDLARFYCQGGFDFDRLCTLDKLAMAGVLPHAGQGGRDRPAHRLRARRHARGLRRHAARVPAAGARAPALDGVATIHTGWETFAADVGMAVKRDGRDASSWTSPRPIT